MHSHEVVQRLVSEFALSDLNEADTRHRIIDPLLHDVLGWPRSRVRCEEYIQPGYADYVLLRQDDSHLLFIEAKKEGSYFSLPADLVGESPCGYIKVKVLMTDAHARAAITQVREYCLNTGCEFAAVTNGHQWVFFKTFQNAKDWREMRAFVVTKLTYFSDLFIEAHNHLSYQAIVDRSSLRRLLLDAASANRELFYPKDRITAYDAQVDANGYASSLRPIVDKYFGAIDVTDARFVEHCYVSDREYDLAFINARRRLEDSVTPYLEAFDIKNFRESESGGSFGNRIAKNVIGGRAADVVVLFGGKGVGKSTFLKRLLFYRAPHVIEKNGVIAMVDLLTVPPDAARIQIAIWEGIAAALDQEQLLTGSRDGLCSLFADRYEQAKNQDLFGLDEKSEAFNVRLNALVSEWKADHSYLTQRLAARVRARHKAVIVVVDNTDQFEEKLQELCFAVGQSIAATFPCVVIMAMREERFHTSAIRGVLDAYQNSGFHITSPEPKTVFTKRVKFVVDLLKAAGAGERPDLPERIDPEAMQKFFRIMVSNFQEKGSHLANFITACSHGNIRLALELFRGFVVSGYTNVQEMLASDGWTLQIHQVVKPFMIPSRFFYSETLSRIPNIFQIRSKSHGSHFTALRILESLSQGHDNRNPPFVPVAKLSMPFIESFAMKEDFQLNMDVLLKHRLIEANNRLDVFDELVDSVRITSYGVFLLRALSHEFTYLELTAEDCAIADLQTANEIAELSNDEYRFYVNYKALERVEVRLRRAAAFLKYLEDEEERESLLYRASADWIFTRTMRAQFDQDKVRVMRSARRNVPRKSYL